MLTASASKMQNWIGKHWLLVMLVFLSTGIVAGLLFFRTDLFGAQPVVINGIAAPPVPTLDPVRVAEGETLYTQHCASCHGRNLEGAANWKTPLADGSYPPPPHDSSGHTWHHKDEVLMNIILNGGNPKNTPLMPAYKEKLTASEVVAILDFMKSKWGEAEREFQWWMTAVGDKQ
jgi:mono/diheme cytochrome c family protein